MGSVIDIVGQRYGLLVVLSRAENNRRRQTRWNCRCDCGDEVSVDGSSLRAGHTRSCGCLKRNQKTGLIHGKTGTREHSIWLGMISRCENPNVKCFSRYGGRGIKVCDRWRHGGDGKHGFEHFLEDMGTRPSADHSLERLDANGDYEPGNVIWSTKLAQSNNKERTRYVTYRGERMALCDAVRLAGSVIHREAAWIRIKTGWPVERAVETPRLHESHNSNSRKRAAKEAA